MQNLEKYLVQNIWNPKYLFHGSPFEIDILEPRKSEDAENIENVDEAIFLTSWFINAVAYAFRDKLKMVNEHWDFAMNNSGEIPAMTFEVENLPNDLYGYVYVFEKSDDIIKDNHNNTTQYRCYHNLKPIDVVKVYYEDYKEYFKRENELKR